MGRPCGHDDCAVSTGIHEGLTFGRGSLDFNGYWDEPCDECARDWERQHPEDAPCWPFIGQSATLATDRAVDGEGQ